MNYRYYGEIGTLKDGQSIIYRISGSGNGGSEYLSNTKQNWKSTSIPESFLECVYKQLDDSEVMLEVL